MSKILRIFFTFFPLLLLGMAIPSKANPMGGSEQYYQVVFDKEQEASVLGRLSFLNRTQDEIKNIKLEIPGQSIRILDVIQITTSKDKYCNQYDYSKKPANGSYPCLAYVEQIGIPSYALLSRDLNKDTKTNESLKVEIPLKTGIKSSEVGTILIHYKAKGFTNKAWNGYSFEYKTVKTDYDTDKVRVAVDVTDDLYIQNTAESNTNYQSDLAIVSKSLSTTNFSQSAELDEINSSVTYAPGIVKETTSLDPNENFSVKGKYFESRWLGQLPTILAVSLTFILIIIVLMVIIRKENK